MRAGERDDTSVRRWGPAVAVLAPVCALAGPALAQTPPPTRDVVLRLRADEPVAVPEFGDVRCLTPPLTAADAAKSGQPLEAVTLEGAAALPQARLEREWSALVGRPVDEAVLRRLGERVACVYREAGYVFAHAEVAPEAEPGHVRVKVSEGRVAALVVRGGTPAARAFVEKAFAPVKTGEPLRLAELRRGLSLARSYGFWGLQPAAEPSPDDPDALVLTLTLEEPKPSVYVSVQNLSAPTVGTWSASASLSGHLTPLYDHTTLGLFHGLTDDRQQGVALSSDVLLTRGGLGLRGDLSWFEERPDEKPPNPDTIGRTKLARVELSHPLLAKADTLVTGRIGLEAVNQDVKQVSGPATERDRLRVAFAGVRVDARRGRSSGYVSAGVRQGLDALGASQNGDALLSRPTADPQATVWRFDAQALQPVFGGTLDARARGQWTDKALLGFEEFTYGGFYGGRGLDPGALQGDRGFAATLEWRGPAKALPGKWKVSPVAFVDYARAWNEDAFGPAKGEALFGGGGVRLGWNDRVNLDLVYAHPLSEPHGVAPGLAGPRLQVLLTAGFDVRW